MQVPLLTDDVAEREGIGITQIRNIVAQRLIPQPVKDRSGRYLWSEQDIARLRAVAQVDRRLKANRAQQEEPAHATS